MMLRPSSYCVVLAVVASAHALFAQEKAIQTPISVAAHLVLDAAGPEQRQSLDAIYLIECPSEGNVTAGTGFLLDSGVMVTNTHVTATCDSSNLIGVTASNHTIKFSAVIKDPVRDLALLIPKDKLWHGLRLAAKDNPLPGTVVSTWGYPLLYNGATPLLSVGYVSGFRTDTTNGGPVKHIVVNGAFNHGNSGGPLLVARNNEVIGVVVMTFHFYPKEVKDIIEALAKMNTGFLMGTITKSDGTRQNITEAQVTAMVLEEFYEKTQVMIGEAICGSEVTAMMREHSSDLPHTPVQSVAGQNKPPKQTPPR